MKKFLTVILFVGIIINSFGYESNNNALSDGQMSLKINDIDTKSEMSIGYHTKLVNGNPVSVIIASDTENDEDCAYIDIRFLGKEFDLGMTLCTASDNSHSVYIAYSGFKAGFNFGHSVGGISLYGDFDINDVEPDSFFIALDGQLEWLFGKENKDLKFIADYNGSALSLGIKYQIEENMSFAFTKNNGGDYLDIINNDDYDFSFIFSMKLER
ncbi:MAG: hypothetical protein M0R46_08460 [Candidatus Muirbacterium halophilum]|nr:hypothetical protein [Candidatus Muirbacterium halophilum]MCK9475936.1 hypothetical protein [Candidatus Muirbacterium halophilum]